MGFSVCYHLYSGVTLTNRIDTARTDRIIVLLFLFASSLVDKSGLTSTHYQNAPVRLKYHTYGTPKNPP